MDFDRTESRHEIAKMVAAVTAGWGAEREAAADTSDVFPVDLHRSMAEAGLFAHRLPSRYGGADGDLVDVTAISRELGRHSDLAVSIYLVNCVAAEVLVRAGDESLCEQLLPRFVAGDLLLSFALTEPDAGSDPGGITTQAVRAGDEYAINGTKLFTTGASNADYLLTVARTDPAQPARTGSSIMLVPGDTPGLHVEPLDKIFGNAHASCTVTYRDVRVPAQAVVGPLGGAWRLMAQGIAVERLIVAGWLAGLAEKVQQDLVEFARSRHQFGRAVGGFQAVAHHIADIAVTAESMWLMAAHAAWRADRDGAKATRHVSGAKIYCAERISEILSLAIRLTGGRAYLRGHPLQRHLRASMLGFYAGGTDEIARNAVARSLGLDV